MNKNRSMTHLRSTGIMAVWSLGAFIVWRIIVSIDAVQRAGFAVQPWRSDAYPLGLPWLFLIDAGFLTVLILMILALGRRLRDLAFEALPRLRSVGAILRLLGILAAVIIGYFAYDDLIYSPLYWQDIGWIYKLVFWLLVAGVSVLLLLQLGRAWYELDIATPRFVRAIARFTLDDTKPRSSREIILRPRAETPSEASPEPPPERPPLQKRCNQCQAILPQDALFCIKCGEKVPDDAPD